MHVCLPVLAEVVDVSLADALWCMTAADKASTLTQASLEDTRACMTSVVTNLVGRDDTSAAIKPLAALLKTLGTSGNYIACIMFTSLHSSLKTRMLIRTVMFSRVLRKAFAHSVCMTYIACKWKGTHRTGDALYCVMTCLTAGPCI